mmetsp:Transcript_6021/g.15350  ORF Transcript_6021/g.15350 Transcript_6021/m.15350 type:complete len:102 (+) Transcript_6021:133-438(+)
MVTRTARQAKQAYQHASEVSDEASGVIFAIPKRIKRLEHKARIEAAGLTLFTPQKGWPRGFEFGVHRVTRKPRLGQMWDAAADWGGAEDAAAEEEKGKLAW